MRHYYSCYFAQGHENDEAQAEIDEIGVAAWLQSLLTCIDPGDGEERTERPWGSSDVLIYTHYTPEGAYYVHQSCVPGVYTSCTYVSFDGPLNY